MTEEHISLAHGSGGKASHNLIKELILKYFKAKPLSSLQDGALVDLEAGRWVMTTDSYIIQPLFFPGGDIGKLAVCGTVNDLAVMGARPRFISVGLIIEEGLEISVLDNVLQSMANTAKESDVEIVTGDLKVTERGTCDKLFINTTGIGFVDKDRDFHSREIKEGDSVILNGTLGDHAIAVLSARKSFDIATEIKSDCAPLSSLIDAVLAASDKVKFMRDPTRGGVATTLNEIIEDKSFGIALDENAIPVRGEVKAACEILGFEPLYLANEGKVLVIVDAADSDKVLDAMRKHPLGKQAALIGKVVSKPKGKVCIESSVGGTRIVDMLVGEPLPRIC